MATFRERHAEQLTDAERARRRDILEVYRADASRFVHEPGHSARKPDLEQLDRQHPTMMVRPKRAQQSGPL